MSVIFDFVDWLFSFALMVLAIWFLIIVTPLLIRMYESWPDDEVADDWREIRYLMGKHIELVKEKYRGFRSVR